MSVPVKVVLTPRRIRGRPYGTFSLTATTPTARIEPTPGRVKLFIYNTSAFGARLGWGVDPGPSAGIPLLAFASDEFKNNQQELFAVRDAGAGSNTVTIEIYEEIDADWTGA